MEIKQFIFDRISEDSSEILFTYPLEIDYWVVSKKDNLAMVYFDFGLRTEIYYNNWLTKNIENIDDKIKKIIEFEIFHAFMHTIEDPNYSVLNWALFGNLFYRVKCLEIYDENTKDIWSYKIGNDKLIRVQHENIT